MAKWDPERTFVTAQRIFGVVHSFSFFSSFSLTSASLATSDSMLSGAAVKNAKKTKVSAARHRIAGATSAHPAGVFLC